MATHCSILAWKMLWTEGYSPWSHKKLGMTQQAHTYAHIKEFYSIVSTTSKISSIYNLAINENILKNDALLSFSCFWCKNNSMVLF